LGLRERNRDLDYIEKGRRKVSEGNKSKRVEKKKKHRLQERIRAAGSWRCARKS